MTRRCWLDGHPGFAWPATTPGTAYSKELGGTEYFLSTTNGFDPNAKSLQVGPTSYHRLRIWALSNTQSLNANSPVLALRHGVINVETYSFPPLAEQREGSVPLADCLNDSKFLPPLGCWTFFFTKKPAGTEREAQRVSVSFSLMQQVVFADGKLWGALNTALDLGNKIQAGVAYFVIEPQLSTAAVKGTVRKQGYLRGLPITISAIRRSGSQLTAKG